MGKPKHQPEKKTKRKSKNESSHKENNNRNRGPIVHIASSGWTQSSFFATLGAFALLVAALVTHTQVKSAAIVFGIVGTVAVWVITGVALRLGEMPPSNEILSFKVATSIVPADAYSSLFWLRNPPDTLSAIPISIFVVVTNSGAHPVTIDSIRVEFKEPQKGWRMLSSIPTFGKQIYFVYGIPAGLKDAGVLDFSKTGLDQALMGKPLLPNLPVRGWMLFARPEGFIGTVGTSIQWRFTAEDAIGEKFQAVTVRDIVQSQVTAPNDLQMNDADLVLSRVHLDISNEIKNISLTSTNNPAVFAIQN